MANIAAALKEEITRLSKKVIKQHLQSVQKSSSSSRKQIAALKREIAALRKEVVGLRRASGGRVPQPKAAEGDGSKSRFQARGLRSLRTRLDLSASDLGKIIGVTGQTIYNWESAKATPRQSQVNALAEIRSIGKREATARLEKLAAG